MRQNPFLQYCDANRHFIILRPEFKQKEMNILSVNGEVKPEIITDFQTRKEKPSEAQQILIFYKVNITF